VSRAIDGGLKAWPVPVSRRRARRPSLDCVERPACVHVRHDEEHVIDDVCTTQHARPPKVLGHLCSLLRREAGGRERVESPSTSSGLAASCTSVRAPDSDLVAEDDRDLVRVTRAPEVAEQRDPRPFRRSSPRGPSPGKGRRRAGTTAVATRVAVRRRCAGRARTWRRARHDHAGHELHDRESACCHGRGLDREAVADRECPTQRAASTSSPTYRSIQARLAEANLPGIGSAIGRPCRSRPGWEGMSWTQPVARGDDSRC
jgi:hypothetical protein